MTDWNFADVWDEVAAATPDRTAIVQGDLRLTWADLRRRSTSIARSLLAGQRDRTQQKVALFLFNGPEYLESMYGAFAACMVPVNVNFRFGVDELHYLLTNSDSEVLLFDTTLQDTVARVRDRDTAVKRWVCVGPDAPEWSDRYEDWAAMAPSEKQLPARSGDDVFMLYTGGTTGMPKGVEWRQDDMFCNLNATALHRFPETSAVADLRSLLPPAPPVHLVACPLMHGAGSITSMSALSQGGTVVLLPSRSFSAEEFLDAVSAEQVHTIALTGDAIARPVVDALDAEPDRWSLDSLVYIVSSAVAWTPEVKARLAAHCPDVRLVDTLGASEGMGVGRSVTQRSARPIKGDFLPGRHTRVLDENGAPVTPGSGVSGLLVVGGRQPLGYYKDPDRSARVWQTIAGERYALTGDYALLEDDGSITLLGRGSASINTGGEKVYPAEVEAVLRTHRGVKDVAVVGVPDDRFGEIVAAVVEPDPSVGLSEQELVAHSKARLAGFKTPRRVVFVPEIARLANGKIDYAELRSVAASPELSR